LLRSFAVSYIPNLGSLLLPSPPGTGAGILSVGSPTFSTRQRQLRPLENARAEAEEVAAIYRSTAAPSDVLTDQEVRREHFLKLKRTGRLSRFACLHLAVHGENLPGDRSMESSLYLQGPPLTALEIAHWSLNADLVILGACWSGKRPAESPGLAELPGDEMSGLQAAFFSAGARQILGSLWPAQDEASYEILTAFHRHLAAGVPTAEALRTATLDYLDSEGDVEAPFRTLLVKRWAPFYLVSLGRVAT
jgi:CHAT domain-containing protein